MPGEASTAITVPPGPIAAGAGADLENDIAGLERKRGDRLAASVREDQEEWLDRAVEARDAVVAVDDLPEWPAPRWVRETAHLVDWLHTGILSLTVRGCCQQSLRGL
jgi:hypothetical protein